MKKLLILLLLTACATEQKPVYKPSMTGYIKECGSSWLCPDDPACKEMNEADHKLFCQPRW